METQDQLKLYQKKWQEFTEELSEKTKELEHIKMHLESIGDTWDKRIAEYLEGLKIEITNIKNENFVLRKLPEKLGQYLQELIPNISEEIKDTMLEDLEKGIGTCHENLEKLDTKTNAVMNQLDSKTKRAMDRIDMLENMRFKKLMMTLILVVIVSTITASGSAYFIMEKFPSRVHLTADKDVYVGSSDVFISGQKNTKIMERKK